MTLKEPEEFINREVEIEKLRSILSGRPNFIYFVYGPINTGKTALLKKVLEELPKNYRIFYINFRWRDVQDTEDLIRVLFKVKRGVFSNKTKDFIKEVLKSGAQILEKLEGIPIPENIFDIIFKKKDKVEDIYGYLEEYFTEIKNMDCVPVFVLDEMQSIKYVINRKGMPVISGLFNFMVGMTKEKHLCHCICATSDCLFIEDVYSSARLEGRAKYMLIDDLSKESAFKVYDEFGFQDRELVWEYIGGKFGDILSLYEDKKQGYPEKEILQSMLNREIKRLEWLEIKKLNSIEDGDSIWNLLKKFKDRDVIFNREIKKEFFKISFWIEENVLFYDPLAGSIRPQGRLIHRAIKEV